MSPAPQIAGCALLLSVCATAAAAPDLGIQARVRPDPQRIEVEVSARGFEDGVRLRLGLLHDGKRPARRTTWTRVSGGSARAELSLTGSPLGVYDVVVAYFPKAQPKALRGGLPARAQRVSTALVVGDAQRALKARDEALRAGSQALRALQQLAALQLAVPRGADSAHSLREWLSGPALRRWTALKDVLPLPQHPAIAETRGQVASLAQPLRAAFTATVAEACREQGIPCPAAFSSSLSASGASPAELYAQVLGAWGRARRGELAPAPNLKQVARLRRLVRRLSAPAKDPVPVREFLAADLRACLEVLASACEGREEFGGSAAARELRTAPAETIAQRLRLLAKQIKRAWAVEDQAELAALWGELKEGGAWRELSWRRRVTRLHARAAQASSLVRRLIKQLTPFCQQGAAPPTEAQRAAWHETWGQLERELEVGR